MTYSIEWVETPSNSRLVGLWRVKVVKASHLPREDLYMLKGSSDPFVEVVAYSDNNFGFRQRSTTKIRTLNPSWGEVFELPVARSDQVLKDTLADFDIIPEELSTLFPPEKTQAEMLKEKVGRRPSTKQEDSGSFAKRLSERSTHSSRISDPFHDWEALIAKTARVREVSETPPEADPEDRLCPEEITTQLQAPKAAAAASCFSCAGC